MLRARGWALALGLAALVSSRDDEALRTLGIATINAALNDEQIGGPAIPVKTLLVDEAVIGESNGSGDRCTAMDELPRVQIAS